MTVGTLLWFSTVESIIPPNLISPNSLAEIIKQHIFRNKCTPSVPYVVHHSRIDHMLSGTSRTIRFWFSFPFDNAIDSLTCSDNSTKLQNYVFTRDHIDATTLRNPANPRCVSINNGRVFALVFIYDRPTVVCHLEAEPFARKRSPKRAKVGPTFRIYRFFFFFFCLHFSISNLILNKNTEKNENAIAVFDLYFTESNYTTII